VSNENVQVTTVVDADPVSIPVKTENKESVENLKDSDIKWRAKYKETKSEYETIKIKSESQEKAFQEKFSTLEKQMQDVESKRINAELKTAAVLEGLNDLDLIKLMDTSNVKIENGEVVGIKEVVSAFKEKKPTYFGTQKKLNSSTNSDISSGASVQSKSANDIPAEDFAKMLQQVSRYSN
jgi:hypothetical protein